MDDGDLEGLIGVSHPNTVPRSLAEPEEPELVRLVLWLPVVRVEHVLLFEAVGGSRDVDEHPLRNGVVGSLYRVIFGTGSLDTCRKKIGNGLFRACLLN